MATKRTDIHRPGAIVPVNYSYVLSYSLPGVEAWSAWNLPEARAVCESVGWSRVWGSLGKCGVCGAAFLHGDLWRHEPTGDILTIGHDCADKYELFASRPDWEAAVEATKTRRAAMRETILRDSREADFLAAQPDFAAIFAFEGNGYYLGVVSSMRQNVRRFGSLTPKQMVFARKLYAEAITPKAPEAPKVEAPTGRVDFEGEIVGQRVDEGLYGLTTKITVKVATPAGEWLAFGTKPSGATAQRGERIKLRATLQPGREKHFAFFKRPMAL